jgi:hypothetical protein
MRQFFCVEKVAKALLPHFMAQTLGFAAIAVHKKASPCFRGKSESSRKKYFCGEKFSGFWKKLKPLS